MKILHVAPINVAGVPFSMMEMQRKFGHEVRLVTLHRNRFDFPEDICLELPLPRNPFAQLWRDVKRESSRPQQAEPSAFPLNPADRPRNIAESLYFRYDDHRREPVINRAIEEFGLGQFDIIHYDGGKDFFRDARLAQRWKQQGKNIICHYLGSDLRVRGIDSAMDRLSDLNLTNESDHLLIHPKIHYIFIPFDASTLPMRKEENRKLRIIHSPSNRAMKGTKLILPVIRRLQKVRDVEFLLVEATPHNEVLRLKQTCDIAIEQVGNFGGTGYGRNSLEALAMGIPTITEMTSDYVAWLPENPFVLATPDSLYDRLVELIDYPELRRAKALAGRAWVEKYHSYESVHTKLMELYSTHGIR